MAAARRHMFAPRPPRRPAAPPAGSAARALHSRRRGAPKAGCFRGALRCSSTGPPPRRPSAPSRPPACPHSAPGRSSAATQQGQGRRASTCGDGWLAGCGGGWRSSRRGSCGQGEWGRGWGVSARATSRARGSRNLRRSQVWVRRPQPPPAAAVRASASPAHDLHWLWRLVARALGFAPDGGGGDSGAGAEAGGAELRFGEGLDGLIGDTPLIRIASLSEATGCEVREERTCSLEMTGAVSGHAGRKGGFTHSGASCPPPADPGQGRVHEPGGQREGQGGSGDGARSPGGRAPRARRPGYRGHGRQHRRQPRARRRRARPPRLHLHARRRGG